ncbi:MAG: ThuA domain-containing protein [Anaerolineae bacterium]|nr:ThuA domain-containing protein [Anaerolineae bacterium]NUQ02893.1 ThuA domain-containing protein [Anaerolineae bacterium]
MTSIRVTVWNEFRHEKQHERVIAVYPDGIHTVIGDGLKAHGVENVRYATLDEPEHGLTTEVLAETDVLLWWGHMAHGDVQDEIVERVAARVLDGMGLIVLHSGHYSKIFKRLMGTTCDLKWREMGERERVWCVNPAHPIAEGLPDYFEIPHHEMYGEPFGIPEPDSLVFVNWFQGGEVFRGGCCFLRGRGKIFYFSPGHETHPIYFQPEVRQVIANAVRWAAPTSGPRIFVENRKQPIEPIS